MAGLATVFGSGAMSNDIAGIVNNKALLVIGSNTSEAHPVIALRMQEAVRRGAKLIVVDPRHVSLADDAAIWLRHKCGSDAALINGLCHVIIREGLADAAFVAERTDGYAAFAEAVAACTPEWAEAITGVPAADIEAAASIFAKAERAGIYYTMGITQHITGTDNVKSLANLAMLCGRVGVESGGVNPLRGQNNVQGACDMGALNAVYPAYQPVASDDNKAKFEKAWLPGFELSKKPGLTIVESLNAVRAESGLLIVGPETLSVEEALAHLREATALYLEEFPLQTAGPPLITTFEVALADA